MSRENPRARYAFLCPYPFFVHTVKTVIEQLPEAEIVPDFTATPGGQPYPPAIQQRFLRFLEESGLPYRTIEHSRRTPLEFFNKYAVLVAPYHEGWMAHPVNQTRKKARVFYGGAKDPWAVGLWNAYFDLICCPGPYHSERLALYQTTVAETGEPKLDGLSTTTTREERQKKLGVVLDTQKETVLVLSTWGTLSALPGLAPYLIALTASHNVIVKAHHMTLAFEHDHVNAFEGSAVCIIDDTRDICDALAISDYVISDNSGAIFDTLHADKPLVLIQTDSATISLLVDDPFLPPAQRYKGTTTSGDSIEQAVKSGSPIAPVILPLQESNPVLRLQRALEESKLPIYKERQQQFMTSAFRAHDGKAGERVALSIRQLDNLPTQEPRLLPTLVRDYERRLRQRQLRKEDHELEHAQAVMRDVARIKKLPPLQRLRSLIQMFFV